MIQNPELIYMDFIYIGIYNIIDAYNYKMIKKY